MTATAARDGLTFDMERALRANTRLAHRLLLAAETHQDRSLQATLYGRLFKAYFCDGENLGDRETLRLHAARAGLDADLTSAALDGDRFDAALDNRLGQAAALGITAVPTFVIDDRWSIPGAQDVEFFERTLSRLLANP